MGCLSVSYFEDILAINAQRGYLEQIVVFAKKSRLEAIWPRLPHPFLGNAYMMYREQETAHLPKGLTLLLSKPDWITIGTDLTVTAITFPNGSCDSLNFTIRIPLLLDLEKIHEENVLIVLPKIQYPSSVFIGNVEIPLITQSKISNIDYLIKKSNRKITEREEGIVKQDIKKYTKRNKEIWKGI